MIVSCLHLDDKAIITCNSYRTFTTDQNQCRCTLQQTNTTNICIKHFINDDRKKNNQENVPHQYICIHSSQFHSALQNFQCMVSTLSHTAWPDAISKGSSLRSPVVAKVPGTIMPARLQKGVLRFFTLSTASNENCKNVHHWTDYH